jgi:diguanylate cyclase (GGDEF)-like protein/PAS domain S-box-containing protein
MAVDSNVLLQTFIDQAPVAIAMLDREMRYVAASRRWLSDYGFGDRDLRGLSHYDLFPEIPDRWREVHRRALAGEVVSCEEDRFVRANGEVQWIRWEIRPWFNEAIQGGITIFAEDVTRRKREQLRVLELNAELENRVLERTAELEMNVAKLRTALEEAEGLRRELHEQAIRDPLTDLFNRRFLEETLRHEVARASRLRSRFGILMFDMDDFKGLNDSFGHAAGDAVLREVGRLISRRIRAQDVACRFGGDEFIIVMPDTALENARHKGNDLLGRLRSLHLEVGEVAIPPMNFSMGVAAYPEHGDAGDELLKAADAALYRAKQQGGGRVIAA